MTILPDNTNFTVFVTHVDAEGPLLRIFGQTDHGSSVNVEKIMTRLTPQFVDGLGTPTARAGGLHSNTICCAMFEGAYYRAKILEPHPSGAYVVKFIDYGNTELVQASDIRLLRDEITDARNLLQVLPQATEFILGDVSSKGETWDVHCLGLILKNLRYNEYRARLVGVVGKRRIINMLVNDQNFGKFLVDQHMAVPASVQDILR